MRDVIIEKIYKMMINNKRIYFLTGDMGAPALDKIKEKFEDRFINIGIAEQNLVNVSTGLALEGYCVFAYAIAPFFMRAYEQIRINLSLSAHFRQINVNLIGVGAGVSYDVSGPTHHCIEDLIIMRALPNIVVFSPCDVNVSAKFVEYSVNVAMPKYIRLDGKPLPDVYKKNAKINWDKGFSQLNEGDDVCIISTGFMTQISLRVISVLNKKKRNIGLIDIFLIKPFNENALYQKIKKYKCIVTIEEAFVDKGGLDSVILSCLNRNNSCIKVISLGFKDQYLFRFGNRESLYNLAGIDVNTIVRRIDAEFN
jgi:transketolase